MRIFRILPSRLSLSTRYAGMILHQDEAAVRQAELMLDYRQRALKRDARRQADRLRNAIISQSERTTTAEERRAAIVAACQARIDRAVAAIERTMARVKAYGAKRLAALSKAQDAVRHREDADALNAAAQLAALDVAAGPDEGDGASDGGPVPPEVGPEWPPLP